MVSSTCRRARYIEDAQYRTFAESGSRPEVGDSVYVKRRQDRKWHRAIVEKVDDFTVSPALKDLWQFVSATVIGHAI